MITRLRYPKGYQFFDANGFPLTLGNLYYYAAGTTTPQDTYSDSAGTVANANPIVLDGSGRLDVDVYLGSAANYKEVLTASSATVSPWPDDNIPLASQPDWSATSGPNVILNKPALAAVATSGSYTDLSNTPATNSPFTGDSGSGGSAGLVPAPAAGDAVANKYLSAAGQWAIPPGLSGSSATNLSVTEAASSVSIGSSSGTGITIPAATSSAAGVLDNARAAKIDGLATVATSGSYSDLSNKPSIPSAPSVMTGATSTANGSAGLVPAPVSGQQGEFLRGDGAWAAVSSAAQVNADWNATSGVAQILNKPALGTAAAPNVPSSGNASTSQVVLGTDSRLSDSRVPQGHASTHASGGSDPISISAGQVSGIPAALAGQNLDNIARVGIGTTDTVNALSVKAPNILFAGTGDMRTTISKGATSNTAAVNFQDNFSTRTQFGLLGNDNFTISTSPDGSTFNNALIATSTGAVSFPNTGGFTGDSGSGGSAGLVPAPAAGTSSGGKYLKADGTWSVPPGSTYSPMTGATSSSAGTSGLVPAPATGQQGNFLRGDGTWDPITASQVSGLATVATSGSYTDLSNQPSIPAAQVNSDWNATSSLAQILNKPVLAAVATSGAYSSLSGLPTLATVATSGSYTDLSNKPTIPAAQVNSDWNASSGLAQILNKPTLGSLAALSSLPAPSSSVPGGVLSSAAASNQFATGINTSGAVTYAQPSAANISGLATVATSGSYADLSNKPTIPAAQVNSDWNASSGLAQILNKPTIPSYSAFGGATSSAAGSSGLVPAPSAGQQVNFLRGDGTWAAVSAGGSTLQVQYNNAGAFGGMSGTSWNNSTQTLGITNIQLTGNIALPAAASASVGTIQQYINGAYAPILHTFSPAGTVSGLNVFLGNNCGNQSAITGTGIQGTQNVGIGVSVMPSLTTGYENMMIGNYCGWLLTSGWNNTFMGTESGEQISSGFANTGFGQSTGLVGTTMYNMSFLGATAGGGRSGHSPYTANNSTYIGALADNWSSSAFTSVATAAGSNVLTFTAVPLNAAVGMYVCDISSLGKPTLFNIPQGAFVTAKTATTLTLSQNVVSTAYQSNVAIGDLVEVFGEVITLATSAATASGTTLTFANVPNSVVIGMTVYDKTTPSVITYGATPTTVTAVTATTVTLSAAVTGAGVGSGDSILFLQSQYSYMTVVGAGAVGNRDNTIFLGRQFDNVVIGGIVSGANAPMAQLTIGGGANPNLPALNIGQTTPLVSTNGDIWRDTSGYIWCYFNSQKGLLSAVSTTGGLIIGSSHIASGLTGTNNTLIGSFAAQNLTSGSYNACVGGGTALTSGGSNTLFGYNAGLVLNTGATNVFIGANAGVNATTATDCTAIGASAGLNLTTGDTQNTFIGSLAGHGTTTGSLNVCVGYYTGVDISTGTGNTFIGGGAGSAGYSPSGNVSNTVLITGGGAPILTATNSSVKWGNGDAVAPTAITFSVQNVVAGTSNTAGVNTTIAASRGTGTGVGGSINFQVAPAGSSGTSQNALTTALSITPASVNALLPMKLASYTYSGLPSASTAGAGSRAWITDSTLAYNGTNLGSAAAGGGSFGSPVTSNGTNWVIG